MPFYYIIYIPLEQVSIIIIKHAHNGHTCRLPFTNIDIYRMHSNTRTYTHTQTHKNTQITYTHNTYVQYIHTYVWTIMCT